VRSVEVIDEPEEDVNDGFEIRRDAR